MVLAADCVGERGARRNSTIACLVFAPSSIESRFAGTREVCFTTVAACTAVETGVFMFSIGVEVVDPVLHARFVQAAVLPNKSLRALASKVKDDTSKTFAIIFAHIASSALNVVKGATFFMNVLPEDAAAARGTNPVACPRWGCTFEASTFALRTNRRTFAVRGCTWSHRLVLAVGADSEFLAGPISDSCCSNVLKLGFAIAHCRSVAHPVRCQCRSNGLKLLSEPAIRVKLTPTTNPAGLTCCRV